MIGWIKKRCNRRRSDPTGGKLKEFVKGIKQVESDFPIYFTLENQPCARIEEENHYEEVTSHTSHLNKDLNPTIKSHTCPLCRSLSSNMHCSCLADSPSAVRVSTNFTEEPIYELAKSPLVNSSYKLERSYSYAGSIYRRPLPEIPKNTITVAEASSSEDECYRYESIGSDSGLSSDEGSDNQVYSGYEPVLVNQDDFSNTISDDSDYEEIETLPIRNSSRRCSLGPSFKFGSTGFKSVTMRKQCLSRKSPY